MKPVVKTVVLVVLILTVACGRVGDSGVPVTASDPLPSWNDGDAKEQILQFVARVTDPASPDFVPEAERIATFDNDGTLWSEKPAYFQLFFAMDRIREMAPEHPEWQESQPFRGVLEGDLDAVAATGEPVLVRRPEIDFIDDKHEKPVAIHKFIGRRPIAAFGNSDGDLQMLQWATAGPGARLGLIVHHTDADREWAYDRESHVGRLDEALEEARENGWIVVSVKQDWSTVHAYAAE